MNALQRDLKKLVPLVESLGKADVMPAFCRDSPMMPMWKPTPTASSSICSRRWAG